MNLEEHLITANKTLSPLFSYTLFPKPWSRVDLSDRTSALSSIALWDTEGLGAYIEKQIKAQGGSIGIGGYGERRSWYRQHRRYSGKFSSTERSVHLGLDVWLPQGTELYAILDAQVHSFKDNVGFGNSGPTLVLAHEIQGITVHTLYGHLSRELLNELTPGQRFKAGDVIGCIGNILENGNWPTHVHFQVICDMGDHYGEFPGVTSEAEFDLIRPNCPDPEILLA